MCTTNVFVHVRPDGRRSTTPQVLLCPSSRFGRPCAAHVEVHHPAPIDMHSAAAVNSFPPTPTYSPRPSSRESARSDGSHHSSRESRHSSTSSSHRRQRSPGIYVNGQRVVNSHGNARRERILMVPHPPTPRTPPQNYAIPRTAPPSPSTNLSIPYGSSPQHRESYNRPYIVDERPRIHVQYPAAAPAAPSPPSSSRHSRQTSTSSQGSRHSHSSSHDEEDRRRRRQDREARKAQELLDRINKANAEIASRPAVRVVSSGAEKQATTTSSSARRSRRDGYDVDIVGAMGRMTVQDENWKDTKASEKAAKTEREEREAQDQRLRERMTPQRRATVGPASRRHRVAYDDGLYRLE